MNSRLLIALLCAGAVALACGSFAKHEAQTVQTTTRHSAAVSAGATEHPRVHSSLDVHVEPHALHFALNLTNNSKKNVELEFPNGQQYDFAVVDSVGREVARWGTGRMFTQSVQNRQLDGGDTMRIEERLNASLPSGKYVAVATLRSSNYPISERSPFVLR
jgi:predicted 2-oxoglutarate/Fe(II)-dependent dioxygenase YbiX